MTLEEAVAAGMTERQARYLVAAGEWRRPYRGVFIDNAAPVTPLQAVIAASRAVGRRGLASHRLALWIWQLIRSRDPLLEFSVIQGRSARLAGVLIHRVQVLPRASLWRGIPVTSPMRALLDTAAVDPGVVTDALINGFTSKLITPKAVRAELDRAAVKGKPGVNALRAALKDPGIGRYAPSQLEYRARKLFRAAGLPDPHAEVVYGDEGHYRIDFYWPEADLMIEVDGWSLHAHPAARRRDNRKSNRNVIGNHWLLRYDWFDIEHDAVRTAAEVREAYDARTALFQT